ncbi:MAG: hypothetical protein IVW52_12845 [Acidimicrobiales bacterium]|nr:hypothetical protein [Acidimicrobiales bacterium]
MPRKPVSKVIARPTGDVGRAVQRDLDAIAETSPNLATGGLAAMALALAQSIDSPRTSATAKSMCSRALVDALARLTAQIPPKEDHDDQIDDLASRRAHRIATTDNG